METEINKVEIPDYVTSIDKIRLMFQKQMSRIKVYNTVKDTYKGAHERDVLRIVDRFRTITNYKLNEEETKVYNKGNLRCIGSGILGLVLPFGLIATKSWREILVNTKRKKIIFGCFCLILGYGNYIGSKSNMLYNLVQLNESPMAYVTFQIMCQPPYRKYRNKWQTNYNLSSIAHRYQRFDFEKAMNIGTNNDNTTN